MNKSKNKITKLPTDCQENISSEFYPIAHGRDDTLKSGYPVIITQCPFCGKEHIHGADDDTVSFRLSHCPHDTHERHVYAVIQLGGGDDE